MSPRTSGSTTWSARGPNTWSQTLMKPRRKCKTRRAPRTSVSAPAQKECLVFQRKCPQAYFFTPFSLTDVRKRHKKDHDKKLKHEERRSSGEHRRSGGQQAARRASAGRRRDWNSDESSDGSPPPNLNDGTVFSCCVSPVDHTFVLITSIIMYHVCSNILVYLLLPFLILISDRLSFIYTYAYIFWD